MMLQLIYSPVLPILHATGLERIQSFCAHYSHIRHRTHGFIEFLSLTKPWWETWWLPLQMLLFDTQTTFLRWSQSFLKSVLQHVTILSLLSPLLYPGLSLFLQLSHCGTADWATSLYHKALSVEARSQLAESFPRFLHALVVLPFHPCSHSDTVASSVQVCCWWVRSGTATIWVRAKEAACTF